MCISIITGKLKVLKNWHDSGKETNSASCLLIGYEAYRALVTFYNTDSNKKIHTAKFLAEVKGQVEEYLLDPGNVKVMAVAKI